MSSTQLKSSTKKKEANNKIIGRNGTRPFFLRRKLTIFVLYVMWSKTRASSFEILVCFWFGIMHLCLRIEEISKILKFKTIFVKFLFGLLTDRRNLRSTLCGSLGDFLAFVLPGPCGSSRDGNGAGHFGYPPRPAPNGAGYYFPKRVWDFF